MSTDAINEVWLEIDGQAVSVPRGTNVVDAARRLGIEIPVFCHHPRLDPVGMCRMCLVEVGTPLRDRTTGELTRDDRGEPVLRLGPTLVTGCTTLASEGMVVLTATEAVSDAQRSVLELLLTSHPLDCPVCDKGGECSLQDLTMRHGPGRSRFVWSEKYRFRKPVPCGPLIMLDRERCVLCARCIRFQDEIAADPVLGFENRSRGMEVITFSDPPFDSYFSGNTTDICPVGALTTNDFRFEARAWEVTGRPGVCTHCPVGCNIMHDVRHGRIERVMPRQNDAVNEIWICDKGRFAHHYAAAPERLTEPLVRRDGDLVPAAWDEALDLVADRLGEIRQRHGPVAIGGIAGDGVPNEDLYLFGRFLRAVLGTNNVDHRPAIVRDDTIARAGAGVGTNLTALGHGTTVVTVGLDVEEEAPVLFLNLLKAARNGARIVTIGGRSQKLDRHAATALRYHYGAEDALLTVLLAGVFDSMGGALAAGYDALRREVARLDAAALAAVHPTRESDLTAAVSAIAAAGDLLVAYGREALASGLVPALAALVGATAHVDRANNGLLAVGAHANGQGAADMGLLPDWLPGYRPLADDDARSALAAEWPEPPPTAAGLGTAAMLGGGVRALYIVGTDPVGDDPGCRDQLAALDCLVVQELFLTKTAQLADVVLPAQSAAERDGTFTNMLRRVQRFQPAARPVGNARPDWAILRDLGQRFGRSDDYGSAADVMAEIARAVPAYAGLTHEALGPSAPPLHSLFLPFAPGTDSRPVTYDGTCYANTHGEGRSWPVELAGLPGADWRPRPPPPQVAADLVLVPIRLLYDAGTLLAPSAALQPLVPRPYVVMNPCDARPRGLQAGMAVRVTGERGVLAAELRLQEGVTPGVVLAPEGLAWEVPVRALMDGVSAVAVAVTPA